MSVHINSELYSQYFVAYLTRYNANCRTECHWLELVITELRLSVWVTLDLADAGAEILQPLQGSLAYTNRFCRVLSIRYI